MLLINTIIHLMQRILLLPEISHIVINGDSMNVIGQPYCRLVSELSDNMNDEHDMLSHKAISTQITVSGLTASWTHV